MWITPNKYSIAQARTGSNIFAKKFKISLFFHIFAHLFYKKMKNVIDKNSSLWYHIFTLKNS